MEMEKHLANINKNDDWILRKIWHPVITHIKSKGNIIIK